jgi:hypothetical protein
LNQTVRTVERNSFGQFKDGDVILQANELRMNHFLGYGNVDRLGSIQVCADVEFTQADDGPANGNKATGSVNETVNQQEKM